VFFLVLFARYHWSLRFCRGRAGANFVTVELALKVVRAEVDWLGEQDAGRACAGAEEQRHDRRGAERCG
jgi:hypothetical protein